MIPTFVIFLREGVEASMIIAILLSYLGRIGQRRHFHDVFVGVAFAFVLILVGGVAAFILISRYQGSSVQMYFETITYVVAAAVMTGMTVWMHQHARTMSAELQARSDTALTKGNRVGLALLAFQSVGREGLETMVFTLAIIFASTRQAATPLHGNLLLAGAVLGLAVSLAIAFAIYRLGAKVNLKLFFRGLGILLMFFAAGLLVDAVQNLQQMDWLTVGTHVLWHSNGLSEASNFGDVLHSLLGYSDHPTVLQGVVWVLYVSASLTAFVGLGRRPRASSAPVPTSASPTPTRPH